jgi:hypothetical protein
MFDLGDTIYFPFVHQKYTLATDTWADANPDSGYPKITIIDPVDTTQVDAIAMTSMGTGLFEYLYTIASVAKAGTWTGFIEVQNDSYPDFKRFTFKVGQ